MVQMLDNPTIQKSIELAIKTEEIGAKFYDELAERFKDEPEIRDIFAQLAKDEKTHEKQFKELLGKAPKDKDIDPEREVYLKAASVSEFFKTDAFKGIAKVEKPEEVIQRAFRFEKSTLFYYYALKDVIGESEELDAIIKMEKQHMTNLMKVMLNDAKFRGTLDAF
jgi:rubrerythrin